ncbi:28S rRNA (cytosine-C(5))-methyltransferase [Halyomorpha halys]|uniref:28S rRNA (cytosine-C(5))-methyltransferase n=1 Tax=Halyomorpha halys TaxID=286706 RepID=UPI0006D5178F|nr:probable 28S rRNA (cytosine-C(5))-methyltransferase [Halyomorpha halys]
MELYENVARLALSAESGQSYKNKLFSVKNKKKIKSLHYLCVNSVKKKEIIDKLLLKVGVSDITWLKRVLLYEFLWGRRKNILNLRSNAVVGEIIKFHEAISKHLRCFEKETINKDEVNVARYVRINLELFTIIQCTEMLKKHNFQNIESPKTYESFLEKVKQLKDNEFMNDFHIPNLLVFKHNARLQQFAQNQLIRQDKSSCLVLPLLAPLPGSTILDMCAAPGYKTQHAAAYISKLGRIYSVDINKERFKILNNTVKLFNLEDCCTTLNIDVLKVKEDDCPNVEYIILDAPCSGTGMSNALIKHVASETRLQKLHNLQVMLLKHALMNFSCVRRVVYSTCSITEEENEEVVSECLEIAKEQGFHLVPLTSTFKGSFSLGKGKYPCSPFVLRTSPQQDLTNGFFVALFERSVPLKKPCWDISTEGNISTFMDTNESPTEDNDKKNTTNELADTLVLKMKKKSNKNKRKKKTSGKSLNVKN